MSINARSKGIRGERIIIDWLQPIVDRIYKTAGLVPPILQRNIIQSDRGGSDITGLGWLAAEVKNVVDLAPGELLKHWQQCHSQATEGQTPILFYIVPRRGVRVRMMGWVGGHVSAFPEYDPASPAWHGSRVSQPDFGCESLVDISVTDFERWFEGRINSEIAKRKKFRAQQGEYSIDKYGVAR